MSWIVQDFWRELDSSLGGRTVNLTYRMFDDANQIAAKIGKKWGLTIQLNFPAGTRLPSSSASLGRANLSLLIEPGRRKFQGVSETDVKLRLEQLVSSAQFEPAGHGYEGFRALFSGGRIDCLPGGIHLWCEITGPVIQFLDWLFANAYGMGPAGNEKT